MCTVLNTDSEDMELHKELHKECDSEAIPF